MFPLQRLHQCTRTAVRTDDSVQVRWKLGQRGNSEFHTLEILNACLSGPLSEEHKQTPPEGKQYWQEVSLPWQNALIVFPRTK